MGESTSAKTAAAPGQNDSQKGAQLVGQLHAGGHQVVATAHQGAQRADLVGLRGQGFEAVAVGAQQIGQQVSVGRVALGAVAAVARSGGLDDVGVDRHDGQPASTKVSTTRPEGRSMATGGLP